jgi:ABC-type branched-subunit amino acid transport system ATPase component
MLEAVDLHAGYGRLPILRGVSLQADAGAIVGVIGPNGAGKSTLLKTIFGYLRPSQGHCRFDGRDITGRRPDEIVRLGLAYVAQARGLFPDMTVDENLLVAAHSLPSRTAARAAVDDVYQRFPVFAARRRQLAGTMSGGQRRLLEVVRALVVEPRMILLDEPSAALAPALIDEVYAELVKIRRRGIALVIVEQNVDRVLDVADRVVALTFGRRLHEGPPAAFDAARLRDVFLGPAAADAQPRS